MQIGFVGLGRMGLNMVTRLVRGGHSVVAHDRSADAVARADAAGAKGVSTLDALIDVWRPLAPYGSWSPRRSHGIDGQRARPGCCRPATRSSTAATSNFHDDVRRARGWRPNASTTSTPARAAASGACRKATASWWAASLRSARGSRPIFLTLAPTDGYLRVRRSRRRPLREDDSQRDRVRPDAGVPRVRLMHEASRSTSAPSPVSGTTGASCDPGCWSWRRGRWPGRRSVRAQGLRGRFRRGTLDAARSDRARRSAARDDGGALHALPLA